jgi:hypothetical protein
MTRRKNTVFKKLKKDVVVALDSSEEEDQQIVTDSQSEEEEEEVQKISKHIEKRLKVTKARPSMSQTITQEDTVELIRQKVLNEGKRVAYQSLFPGHTCPF